MITNPVRTAMIAAFATFTLFTGIVNIQPHGWLDWYHISKEGKKTQAQITRKLSNHNTCLFKYALGTKVYHGSEGGCNFKVGESVTVIYLPSNSSFATLKNPNNELGFLIFVPIFVSVISGCMVAFPIYRKA